MSSTHAARGFTGLTFMQTLYQQRDIRCHHPDFLMVFIDHMFQLEHSIWICSCPLLVFRPGEHSLRIVQAFAPEAQRLSQILKARQKRDFSSVSGYASGEPAASSQSQAAVKHLTEVKVPVRYERPCDLSFRLHIFFDRFKAHHWWFSMTPWKIKPNPHQSVITQHAKS